MITLSKEEAEQLGFRKLATDRYFRAYDSPNGNFMVTLKDLDDKDKSLFVHVATDVTGRGYDEHALNNCPDILDLNTLDELVKFLSAPNGDVVKKLNAENNKPYRHPYSLITHEIGTFLDGVYGEKKLSNNLYHGDDHTRNAI